VLLDGKPIYSCVARVSSAQDHKIETIESLADGDKLHPVQEAFLAEGALQCGYCTPGMIMNAVALLREKPHPSSDEIRDAMDRNICRCGTYGRIMRAVERAAQS
jgi:aerobic-type carbon monoxide dehydrogenase small subunit (CoxS/CutS family)